MQTRYRPYRWGNRIAVGVLLGQVLGMAHSPLAFPASVPDMVQTAMARVAADEVPADTGVVEVEVRLGGATSIVTPTTDLALGAGAGDGGSSTTGEQPADRDAATSETSRTATDTTGPGSATTRRGASATTTREGSTTSAGGGSSTSRATSTSQGADRSSTTAGPGDTSGAPSTTRTPSTTRPTTTRPATTLPSTTVPTTAPTTTRPGSTTTIDDDLPPASGTEPCPLPADLIAGWAVTVRDGDEQAVALRRDVVAAATAIPPEEFALIGPATWQVAGPAGALCTASQLVEVVSVVRLPA